MISTGAFQTEMDASEKQNELVTKLVNAWEKKNSKVARAGGLSLMALSLAACGSNDETPFSQVDVDAAKTAATTAALTGADGTVHASVDAAVTSNDTAIAADATAAAEATAAVDLAAATDATTAAEAATAALQTTYDALVASNTTLQASYDALVAPVSVSLTDDDTAGIGPDALVGSLGADTYTATSATLDATDVINGGDGNDVLNVTSTTGAMAAANISGIETINLSIDSFAAGTPNLTNVSGATVNISTTKSVHNAGLTVTGTGANTVSLDSVMTGTATFNGVSTATIDSGAYTTATVNATTDAPIAVALTAGSATAINLDGDNTSAVEVAANTASITAGASNTLTTEDIGAITVTATDDITVTLANAANDLDTLTLAGASSITVDAAELQSGSNLVDSTTGGTQTANVSTDAVDAGDWTNSIVINLDNAAVNGVTVATGARVEAALNLTGATTITGAAATATTNTVTIDLSATQDTSTTLANFASATLELDNSAATASVDYNAFDSANADMAISVAADATGTVARDVEFSLLDVGTGTATITGTGDVDMSTSFEGVELDASGLTGMIDVATTVDNDATTISGGSGANTVTFATIDGAATYVGQNGGDTVTATAINGTSAITGVVTVTTGSGADDINGGVAGAADWGTWSITTGAGADTFDLVTATTNNTVSLAMGDGGDTATMDALTTSIVEGTMGAGDDTLSVDGLTTGTVSVDMGAGDDTIGVGGAATLTTGANIAIVMGDGDDTLTLGETAALDTGVNVIVTGGSSGSDAVTFASTNVSAATLSFTGVEVINLTTGVETIFSAAQMTGQSYEIRSTAGNDGELTVTDATGNDVTIDLGSLTMNQGAGTSMQIVDINAGAGDDVLTGTNAALTVDTITAGAGADTLIGNAGADVLDGEAGVDTMTGGAGADDFTITIGANADTGSTFATADVITDFVTATDTISTGVAGTNVLFTAASDIDGSTFTTEAQALTAVDAVLDGTVDYAFVYNYGGSGNGYLYYDADGTVTAGLEVISMEGLSTATSIVFGDIVA